MYPSLGSHTSCLHSATLGQENGGGLREGGPWFRNPGHDLEPIGILGSLSLGHLMHSCPTSTCCQFCAMNHGMLVTAPSLRTPQGPVETTGYDERYTQSIAVI